MSSTEKYLHEMYHSVQLFHIEIKIITDSDEDSISKEPEDITAAVFKIAHSHMSSREHVEIALRALSQCCRAERCRVHVVAR